MDEIYEISLDYRRPNVVDIDGEEEYIYKIPKDISELLIYYALPGYNCGYNKNYFEGIIYVWPRSIYIHRVKCMNTCRNVDKSSCIIKPSRFPNENFTISSLLNSLAIKYLYHGILHQTDNSFYRFTNNKYFEPNLIPIIAKFLV